MCNYFSAFMVLYKYNCCQHRFTHLKFSCIASKLTFSSLCNSNARKGADITAHVEFHIYTYRVIIHLNRMINIL
jgi:hypothetical protein